MAHVFEKYVDFVEERILLDHSFPLGGNTLHTCSRKEPSSPPGKAYFTHMFEKYGELGVEDIVC